MSQLPSTFFKIKPLGPNNWYPWKWRILTILSERKLTGFVDGKIKEPVESEDKPAYDDWVDKNRSAMTTLELAISDEELAHLNGTRTAAEMWKSLKDKFGTPNSAHVWGQFESLVAEPRMNEQKSLQDQMMRIVNRMDDITKNKVTLSAQMKALLLLSKIPESYRSMVSALMATIDVDKISVEDIMSKTLAEESLRKAGQSANRVSQTKPSLRALALTAVALIIMSLTAGTSILRRSPRAKARERERRRTRIRTRTKGITRTISPMRIPSSSLSL